MQKGTKNIQRCRETMRQISLRFLRTSASGRSSSCASWRGVGSFAAGGDGSLGCPCRFNVVPPSWMVLAVKHA